MIPWAVKVRVTKWLRRWSSSQRQFSPHYDLESVMDGAICGDAPPGECPRESAARFYRESAPLARCYHSVGEVRSRLGQVRAQYPSWLRRSADRATADLDQSLALYALDGPPLQPGYPWAGTAGDDILFHLRPHRFFFLPCHALGSHHDPSLLARIEAVIDEWCAAARGPANGAAFASALLVLQRLLACHWAWLFVAAHPQASAVSRIELKLLAVMREDVRFLGQQPASSATNNHLLADRFAHWYCSVGFTSWFGDFAPVGELESRFLDELHRQVDRSGWSFEASHHYHEFALDMALIYFRIKQVNDEPLPPGFSDLLRGMLKVQVDTAGPALVECPIGDTIEDNLLPLGIHRGAGPGFYREAYRRLFDPELAPSPAEAPAVEVAYWLLDGLAPPAPGGEPSCSPSAAGAVLDAFTASGIHVFAEPDTGVRAVFRSGPAEGEVAHGGHMHSDWLSVLLHSGSRALLVDPGTYSYRTRVTGGGDQPSWRDYFRSRRAHNTLTLRGRDFPPRLRGDFGPASYAARVSATRSMASYGISLVEAGIDTECDYRGYRRGVLHLPGEYFFVYDLLPAEHEGGEVTYQFADGWELHRQRGGYRVNSTSCATVASLLSTNAGESATATMLYGSDTPRGGWVSTQYGLKVPAPQLVLGFSALTDCLGTVLAPGRELAGLLQMTREPDHLAVSLDTDSFSDRLLISCPGELADVQETSVSGRFGALWLRRWKSGATTLRGARVRDLEVPGLVRVAFEDCVPGLSVDQLPGETPGVKIWRGD